MKRILLYCVISFCFTIFSSCSNSDDSGGNNDIIVGKWKLIERYESDQLVEFASCGNPFDIEYKADNTYFSFLVTPGTFPGDCEVEYSDTGLIWTNLGDSNYRFISDNGEIELFIKTYKNEENLVQEYSNGIVKAVFEPF